MTVVGARHRNARTPVRATAPRWPTLMLAAMTVIGALSVLQGIFDLVVPVVIGVEPFTFLFMWTEMFGPAFFAGYLFIHNLGLACIVPGFGFVASRFEKHVTNRAYIGIILLAAVLASLLVALEYLIQAAWRFDLRFALVLFTIEAAAVLLLAFPSAMALRGFIPTRVYSWALITPFRRLRIPFAISAVILLAASLIETLHVFPIR